MSSSSDSERVKGPVPAVPPHRTPRCVVPQGLLRESDHHGSRFYFTARFIGLLKILDLPCCSGCENLNAFLEAQYCTEELTQPFSFAFQLNLPYCPFLNNLAYWAVRIDGHRLAGTGCGSGGCRTPGNWTEDVPRTTRPPLRAHHRMKWKQSVQ